MKQIKHETTREEAWEIVDASDWGVLSVAVPGEAPYSVPLNLWRIGEQLYFHSAMKGRKTDCLRANPAVSVCFVARAGIVPEAMTCRYASAVIAGRAEEVTDPAEKLEAVRGMCRRYQVPENHADQKNDFKSCMPRTAIWRIRVEEITGKSRG